MQQPPPSPPPPQFSPDGLYWWDGVRWTPRAGVPAVMPQPPAYPPPPPIYAPAAPSSFLKPSPGLRIVLIVALSLEALLTGIVTLVFVLGTAQEPNGDVLSYVLGFAFVGMFVVSGLALLGVSLRTSWSRWAAIAAGILISWTCVGLVIGIPVLVTAARAPDLTPRPN
jgi:hypothetical protein